MNRHLWLVAALLTLAPAARAEDPCTEAVARLCPQSRGDLLMLGCLRANEAEFSRVCQGDLQSLLAKARTLASGCEGDVSRLCQGVQPGDGRVAACLKARESELSQSCQEAFNTWRLGRMEFMASCAGDIGRFCQMVPEGAGRIWSCLKARQPELTSDCRDLMTKL
jgi:Golgi apparatus protein 1